MNFLSHVLVFALTGLSLRAGCVDAQAPRGSLEVADYGEMKFQGGKNKFSNLFIGPSLRKDAVPTIYLRFDDRAHFLPDLTEDAVREVADVEDAIPDYS